MTDVVGLYLNPPDRALVLCVDEKSQIQALDRTQPGLALKKGRAHLCNGVAPLRLKHEKKRGRPRNTTAEKTHFATQAALIEYLMRAGLSERDAAMRVVCQAKKIGAPLTKSTSKSRRSDHDRLLDWRARLRSASPDDENFKFAKATYQRHLDLHKKLKEKFTDKEIADCFLKLFWPELLGKKLD